MTKLGDVEKILFALKKYWADSVWPENTYHDDSGMQERLKGIFTRAWIYRIWGNGLKLKVKSGLDIRPNSSL